MSGVAPANQTKERPVHELFAGASQNKVQCESCLFSQGKTPELTKTGEIHELLVSAFFLVWFAGATPDSGSRFFWPSLLVSNIPITTDRKHIFQVISSSASSQHHKPLDPFIRKVRAYSGGQNPSPSTQTPKNTKR